MKVYKSNIERVKLVKEKTDIRKVKITNSNEAADYARQFYFEDIDIFESVYLLLLNRSNITTGFVKISQGGVSSSIVDIKLIAKYAIESLSSSVILFHNHPTGSLTPSKEDSTITDKIKNALLLLDVRFLDHIILSSESFYSFADNGLI